MQFYQVKLMISGTRGRAETLDQFSNFKLVSSSLVFLIELKG